MQGIKYQNWHADKEVTQQDIGKTLSCAAFSPNLLKQELDPVLVEEIQLLTTPVRESRKVEVRISHSQDLEQPETVSERKAMKQLHCLSTLLFNQC